MREHYDVVIVGYGPVGQLLAILLAQRGLSVGVFEKQPYAYPLPRAVHFDHEVARILQSAGVAAGFAGLTETADSYEWRNAAGATLLRFASRPTGRSGWPDGNMFAQPHLERLLDRRVRSLAAVDVQRGYEGVDIDAGADSATVELVNMDGQRAEAQGSFVIGCDGANSFVRPYLGATVTDLGFFFDWLIVDVVPHEPQVWRPLNIQICDPARPTTLVSGGPGRRRWEFMRLPDESIEQLNSEETAWRLLERWDLTPANATLERHTVYRFQARWVDTWRQGRLLLAGDAAHQMPPFAGQGMCAGLRDAANLAWKLDLVLSGKAPDSLLDTYASERVPHVAAMINLSMELGKVICVSDPEQARARDAVMVEAARDGQSVEAPRDLGIGPGVVLDRDAHAGELFIQGRVRRGRETGLFDDVVATGWTLLSPIADPADVLDADGARFFASIGGATAHIGPGAPVEDVDGTYCEWFDRSAAVLVLQRPDFYVFATAPRLDGASALVAGLRRALGASRPFSPRLFDD